jgi:hypothetical protein
MKRVMVTGTALIAICAGWANSAFANCDAGPRYEIEQSGESVIVCNTGAGYKGSYLCPDSGRMLRENVETGEVVVLLSLCTHPNWTNQVLCFVDECVPKGTYRYGLETPFECYNASCWPTPFYGELTVSADPSSCLFNEENPGPTPYDQPTPWANSKNGYVCDIPHVADGGARDNSNADSGARDNSNADGGARDNSSGESGSCSMLSSGSRTVFSLNAIMFLVGLLLVARRRRV